MGRRVQVRYLNPRRTALFAAVGGLVVVALVAVLLEMPARDALQLCLVAGAAAVVTGFIGAGVLHVLRRSSLAAQVAVVALTSTTAVAAGALAAGNAMFLGRDDLSALGVVVTIGGVVGVVTALLLAARVGVASRRLGQQAARIADPTIAMSGPVPSIREFTRLANQLDDTARQLEESRRREEAAEASRRQLVSWVSHDLRTPLAGIRAITEALEDGVIADPESVTRSYEQLRAEADRLNALVDDLFELSRVEAGSIRLELEPVSLGDLVSDTLASARAVAERKGVQLFGRSNDPTAQCIGDFAELARVLGNLVGNAIRETPEGGAVMVEAGVRDGTPYFAVQDTCGGIPDDVLPHVFEAGFRGQSARGKISDTGGGLGLAISRGLVEAHGGSVSVSNVEHGCKFIVELPGSPAPSERDEIGSEH